jgi:hypothetical protein
MNYMAPTRTHDWIDQRSLALALAIAQKVRREPALFHVAAENIERWKHTMDRWPPALREWEEILEQGVETAVSILVEDTARGRRLRQSNPFAGVLSPRERNDILRRYESISA